MTVLINTSNFSYKIIKVLTGLIITTVFIAFLISASSYNFTYSNPISSGLSFAFMIYYYSVICTAGVSLLIWIPLWYGIGSTALWIIEPFLVSKKRTEIKTKPLTNEEQAIIRYIHHSRIHNIKDEDLTAILLQNGWSEEAIKEAFKHA